MSDSIIRTSQDDIALGAKVISYAAQALAFAASVAIAASCTSAVTAFIVGTICTIVLTLLASIAAFFVTMAMKADHVEAVGRNTHAVIFKVGGWMARAKNAVTPTKVVAA